MWLRKIYVITYLLILVFAVSARAQVLSVPDTTEKASDTIAAKVHVKRLLLLGTAFTTSYTTLFATINNSWYDKEKQTSFHFFNDNQEWKQVDKVGHFWSAFIGSRAGIDMLRWAGVPDKKAIIYGGMLGIVLQTPIEFFDGYQVDYGASVGDMVANTLGSATVIAQELAWQQVRILPKYSFHTTRYAAIRTNVLGSNLAEQALKDYNGQTYWLSVNVGDFLKEESKYPKWLSIAVGYGAEEIVYNSPSSNNALGLQAHRQFYLSPDLNLLHFKGKSKVWNTALYVLSIVKIPAPALEYNTKEGFTVHPLYF